MAIASGLTCVDYLSQKFHEQTLQDQIRYSPTWSFTETLKFTENFNSGKQNDDLCASSYKNISGNTDLSQSKYSPSTTLYEPVLDFQKLNVPQDFQFYYENKGTTTLDPSSILDFVEAIQQNSQAQSRNSKAVVGETSQEISIKDSDSKYVSREHLSSGVFQNAAQLSSENVSCNLDDLDSDDEEIGFILGPNCESKINNKIASDKVINRDLNQFILQNVNNDFKVVSNGSSDSTLSDSECELAAITRSDQDKNCLQCKKLSRKRSSIEFLNASLDYDDDKEILLKRPCIDLEKMHLSSRRRSSNYSVADRKQGDEYFVPIILDKIKSFN